jgi:hypothetical protein
MKRVTVSCTKPPLPLPPRRATIRIKSHITLVATATATSAVTGIPDFACATESVMTLVIVPGLAAKRISGVRDGLASGLAAAGGPGGRGRAAWRISARPARRRRPP